MFLPPPAPPDLHHQFASTTFTAKDDHIANSILPLFLGLHAAEQGAEVQTPRTVRCYVYYYCMTWDSEKTTYNNAAKADQNHGHRRLEGRGTNVRQLPYASPDAMPSSRVQSLSSLDLAQGMRMADDYGLQ